MPIFYGQSKPNKEEFDLVCKELDNGGFLTFRMIGKVFGSAFWELIVISLIDAKESTLEQLGWKNPNA
jgi:hypothetical protein